MRLNLAKPDQEQFGSYVANEVVDDRLVQRQFPLDDKGNLYRGIRDMIPGINSEADLAWHGSSYTSYTNAYAKENNAAANDWSDFIHLLDLLNHAPDNTYMSDVQSVVNVDEWMKYFAVNTLLDNQEASLGIGEGDDFALYRGTNDTRFLLLPYDLDAVMGRGLRTTTCADGIWRMTNVAVIDRFMKRSEFVPLYFKHLEALAETTFAPAHMNPLLDHLLASYVDAGTISNVKAFNSNHVAYVLSQFPRALTVAHRLSVVNGYPRTTNATIALSGQGNAIDTRRVLINGSTAQWTAWQAAWTNDSVDLHPGLNRVLVQALGDGDREVERTTLDVWYDDGSVQTISGAIAANTTWTAAGGPYSVTADLAVSGGVTLTIEPGTTVYFGSGVDMTVANGGRLVAEGTVTAPIRFTVLPGATGSWGGLTINGVVGSPETRIAYAHFEGNGTTCIEVAGGTLHLDHATFGTTSHRYLDLDDSSFVISHCYFPATTAAVEPLHGTGGIRTGGRGIVRDSYFGSSIGYSDIVDFTGGNRPGQPIIQFYNNVFVGSTDDILDLDGTDAWIEGNIFLHVHRNGAPDSSAAVSGGGNGGNASEITIVGNLFFDCDNAVTAKQGNFYTLINNTLGRLTEGVWGLCQPIFGGANLPQLTGDPHTLRINEWLADAQFVARNDFLELHNPDPIPVALGGLFLSDAAGEPKRHPVAPLSFIAGKGYAEFVADSDPEQGADHLSFKLSPDVGVILLYSTELELIDAINYGAQRTDVSEGRSPNGADRFTAFAQPTPGGGNPGTALGDCTLATTTVDLLSLGATWKYNQTANLEGTGWYLSGYNDSAWPSGPALLAVESSTLPSPGKRTSLTLGRTTVEYQCALATRPHAVSPACGRHPIPAR